MYRIVVVMFYLLHSSMDYLWVVVVTFSKACRLVQDAISWACIDNNYMARAALNDALWIQVPVQE